VSFSRSTILLKLYYIRNLMIFLTSFHLSLLTQYNGSFLSLSRKTTSSLLYDQKHLRIHDNDLKKLICRFDFFCEIKTFSMSVMLAENTSIFFYLSFFFCMRFIKDTADIIKWLNSSSTDAFLFCMTVSVNSIVRKTLSAFNIISFCFIYNRLSIRFRMLS